MLKAKLNLALHCSYLFQILIAKIFVFTQMSYFFLIFVSKLKRLTTVSHSRLNPDTERVLSQLWLVVAEQE
jgi:hypothetical protein